MITHPHDTILGDIPDDWSARPLADLLLQDQCCSGSWGDDRGDDSLKILRSTNFTNDGHLDLSDIAVRWFPSGFRDRLQLKAGDILLERSGGGPDQPVGRVLLIESDMPGFGFGNFIQRLRPNADAVEPRFLRWVLYELHRSGIVERLQHQTTQMRNLEFRDYMRSLMPVPKTIDEQCQIADEIDAVDGLILEMKELLGISGSLHRDEMGGPLNHAKRSLLQNLVVGRVRLAAGATA